VLVWAPAKATAVFPLSQCFLHLTRPAEIQDFYKHDGGVSHPLPSKEFMAWREAADKAYADEQSSLIPGL
jgi:hypothetical protein